MLPLHSLTKDAVAAMAAIDFKAFLNQSPAKH
jgi:hypothetical protein